MSDIRISTGEPPRRRIDRETTPGRCGNLDYCSIGMQRVEVRVPISAPFVCPECGGRLRPPGRMDDGSRPWVLPTLRIGVLAGCVIGALGVGYSIGRVQPIMHRAVQTAARGADAGLHQASTALGIDTPAPAPVKPAVQPPAPPPVKMPLPIFVAERPFPAHALPVDVSKPAPRLQNEARFGQVTIDCVLEAAQTHPTCMVADIRGADAISASAIGWLQGLAVQYGPSARAGAPRLLSHRWRIVFQDYGGRPTGTSAR